MLFLNGNTLAVLIVLTRRLEVEKCYIFLYSFVTLSEAITWGYKKKIQVCKDDAHH